MFAGRYAPEGWSLCQGQIVDANKFPTLFSLIGGKFGGDGRTTFGLPDFRGRLAMHYGLGPGRSDYAFAQQVGVETVTLKAENLPKHTHAVYATTNPATNPDAERYLVPATSEGGVYYTGADQGPVTSVAMSDEAVTIYGSGGLHSNFMPSLVISYIIAMDGIYPPRS